MADLTFRSDSRLVEAALSGDMESFERLVERYKDRFYRFILKHVGRIQDAEDILQEAFISAYRGLGQLQNPERFGSWLYGIASNIIRNHFNRSPEYKYTFVDVSEIPDNRSDEKQEDIFDAFRLRAAINELPSDIRETLILVGLEEQSYEDAARILNVPVGTVKSRMFRARKLLRDTLTAEDARLR